MDINYYSNQIGGGSLPVYSGALRQRGAGIGALAAGVSTFAIPLARKYVVPIGREFIRNAAPELINVIAGKTKPTRALKNAVLKTVKKQIGGGARRQNTKKKTAGKASRRPIYRKTVQETLTKHKAIKQARSQSKPGNRKGDIFSSVVDAGF